MQDVLSDLGWAVEEVVRIFVITTTAWALVAVPSFVVFDAHTYAT